MDGHLEVAVLPWYALNIYDARTGQLKDTCQFTKGRSYGYFGVYDFDGDGNKEFLVMADFSKHVDVLGYREGKLQLFWKHEIELDISNPKKILRVISKPASDIDGDGMMEVVLNLYNDTGDGQWHLIVRDGMTGRVKADLVNEFAQDALDLDGDGAVELLTVQTQGQSVPAIGTIRVRALGDDGMTTRWRGENQAWQTFKRSSTDHSQNHAQSSLVGVMNRKIKEKTILVVRGYVPGQPGEQTLSVALWEGNGFKSGATISGHDLEAMAIDGDGAMLVRVTTRSGYREELKVSRGRASIIASSRIGIGSPSPPVVAHDQRLAEPVIVAQGFGEELIAFQTSESVGPILCWQHNPRRNLTGHGPLHYDWEHSQAHSKKPYIVADLRGDGTRQVIYSTAAPTGMARLIVADLSTGEPIWNHDISNVPPGPSLYTQGGIMYCQTGHFTDGKRQDILVGTRRSSMHSEETMLLSGRDGRELWRCQRQNTRWHSRSCGGQPFAVADFNGDGLDDAACLYPSIFYILDGPTGNNHLLMDCIWPEIPIKGHVYWGQPVAGHFAPSTRPSVLFTTRGHSMIGRISADGHLLWSDAYDKAANGFPAVGDFDGDGQIESILVGFENGTRCYDTATGKVEWTLPLGANQNVNSAVSADINGNGRDEAVFVLGRTLYAVGIVDGDQSGSVLWTLDIKTKVSSPVIANVDGKGIDGTLSILVMGADGYVYCVK